MKVIPTAVNQQPDLFAVAAWNVYRLYGASCKDKVTAYRFKVPIK